MAWSDVDNLIFSRRLMVRLTAFRNRIFFFLYEYHGAVNINIDIISTKNKASGSAKVNQPQNFSS